MPPDHRTPVDMREVIGRIVDGSDFTEFGARYGGATLCGGARIHGWPIGVVTNNGPIDPDGAAKATHFIQACCQAGTPLLYLNNTTGFMVGKRYEENGVIKHGSKMIQAVTNATVPQFTILCGASFGAGNYGMCGRGFHPRFLFSWPNAKTAVMGGEQAAGAMRMVREQSAARSGKPADAAELDRMTAQITENFNNQMDAFHTSARVLDDGVIDPRDTREVLALVMAICREADRRRPRRIQFAVARP
jgi:geranyl-CoA carboxylase beta subunit